MNKQEILVKKLIEKKYTISFAESCTGGKMAATIVDVADASKVLNASFVTYANAAKMKYVNVSKETLDTLGAVSEQTAKEMAEGVAKANQANVGVGITGIAGPTGGTVEKPVGTVSVFVSPLIVQPKHTVPTGFSTVPPVGPAIPVIPTPTFA